MGERGRRNMTPAQQRGIAECIRLARERRSKREREAGKRILALNGQISHGNMEILRYITEQLQEPREDPRDEVLLVTRRDEILSWYERRAGMQHNPSANEPTVEGVAV